MAYHESDSLDRILNAAGVGTVLDLPTVGENLAGGHIVSHSCSRYLMRHMNLQITFILGRMLSPTSRMYFRWLPFYVNSYSSRCRLTKDVLSLNSAFAAEQEALWYKNRTGM
jgi:hypothetical protein